MTSQASDRDALYDSLNALVVSGDLTAEEAQTAHDAVRRGDASPRLDRVLIALGSAFVFAAVLLSSFKTRGQGDIDWSNYLMGLAGAAGLLGVAAAAYFLVDDRPLRSNLMAWPGALGAVAVGLMIGVAMDDSDATLYVVGLAIAALSGGGWYVTQRGAFLVSGLLGLALLYGQLFDDLIGFDDVEGDNFAMTVVAVIAFFTVAVTVGGWFLPATRDLTGVVAGIVSVVGIVLTLIALAVVGLVTSIFSGFGDSRTPARDDTFDNDVWVILLIAAVLCAGWAWCSWQTGHMGYRLLILGMVTPVVPLSTLVLAVEHPTYWELVVGLLGAVALGYAVVRALGGIDQAKARMTRS